MGKESMWLKYKTLVLLNWQAVNVQTVIGSAAVWSSPAKEEGFDINKSCNLTTLFKLSKLSLLLYITFIVITREVCALSQSIKSLKGDYVSSAVRGINEGVRDLNEPKSISSSSRVNPFTLVILQTHHSVTSVSDFEWTPVVTCDYCPLLGFHCLSFLCVCYCNYICSHTSSCRTINTVRLSF